MPLQVSGQFVTTKSSKLVHIGGCDGAFAVAAGAALVAMKSSAAETCEHVASRRREPVIAMRQAVRAIVPSCHLPQIPPLVLPSDPYRSVSDARTSDDSNRDASSRYNWNRE